MAFFRQEFYSLEMRDDLTDVMGVAALADPLRRRLYRYVARSAEPVGREEAAAAVEVPVHTAKFHLDRMVDDGLLTVEFRRLSGRSGPGAGRPAKLYRRSEHEFTVSLPALASPMIFALDDWACSRNDEKSEPGNGCRTLPTTLPPFFTTTASVSRSSAWPNA